MARDEAVATAQVYKEIGRTAVVGEDCVKELRWV
jgi:hypothetical protein